MQLFLSYLSGVWWCILCCVFGKGLQLDVEVFSWPWPVISDIFFAAIFRDENWNYNFWVLFALYNFRVPLGSRFKYVVPSALHKLIFLMVIRLKIWELLPRTNMVSDLFYLIIFYCAGKDLQERGKGQFQVQRGRIGFVQRRHSM